MALTRRRFVAAAAAICAGCGSDAEERDAAGPVRRQADEPTTTRADAATTTLADPPTSTVTGPDGSFGGRIDLGAVDDLARRVEDEVFHYVPEGRLWLVRYPPEDLQAAEAQYGSHEVSGIARGFVALHQKCPHLGCRVPECVTSGRFECPCHGSAFTRDGEWISGPAPRGMDRFPVAVVDERLVVDTAIVIQGPDQGVLTVDPEPEGPACVG
jgi:cytochrome b6-f complex iron-sulfur subunit